MVLTTPFPDIIPMTSGPVEHPGSTTPSQEAHREVVTLSPLPVPPSKTVTIATGTTGLRVHPTFEDAAMGPHGNQDIVVVFVIEISGHHD